MPPSQPASMGPRLLSRGNLTNDQTFDTETYSFNGATAFEPWEPGSLFVLVSMSARFNGATAFEPWERGAVPLAVHRGHAASMGPRLLSRGNSEKMSDIFVYAEMASMGPRLLSRGNLIKEIEDYREEELQWGHGF